MKAEPRNNLVLVGGVATPHPPKGRTKREGGKGGVVLQKKSARLWWDSER